MKTTTWPWLLGGAALAGGVLWYMSRGKALGAMLSAARRSCKWVEVCEGSPLSATFNAVGPYLGSGTSKRITGNLQDSKGVTINGTVIVRVGTTVIGHTSSAAGRFYIYDLPQGTYKLVVKTSGGKTAAKNASVGSGLTDVGRIVVS